MRKRRGICARASMKQRMRSDPQSAIRGNIHEDFADKMDLAGKALSPSETFTRGAAGVVVKKFKKINPIGEIQRGLIARQTGRYPQQVEESLREGVGSRLKRQVMRMGKAAEKKAVAGGAEGVAEKVVGKGRKKRKAPNKVERVVDQKPGEPKTKVPSPAVADVRKKTERVGNEIMQPKSGKPAYDPHGPGQHTTPSGASYDVPKGNEVSRLPPHMRAKAKQAEIEQADAWASKHGGGKHKEDPNAKPKYPPRKGRLAPVDRNAPTDLADNMVAGGKATRNNPNIHRRGNDAQDFGDMELAREMAPSYHANSPNSNNKALLDHANKVAASRGKPTHPPAPGETLDMSAHDRSGPTHRPGQGVSQRTMDRNPEMYKDGSASTAPKGKDPKATERIQKISNDVRKNNANRPKEQGQSNADKYWDRATGKKAGPAPRGETVVKKDKPFPRSPEELKKDIVGKVQKAQGTTPEDLARKKELSDAVQGKGLPQNKRPPAPVQGPPQFGYTKAGEVSPHKPLGADSGNFSTNGGPPINKGTGQPAKFGGARPELTPEQKKGLASSTQKGFDPKTGKYGDVTTTKRGEAGWFGSAPDTQVKANVHDVVGTSANQQLTQSGKAMQTTNTVDQAKRRQRMVGAGVLGVGMAAIMGHKVFNAATAALQQNSMNNMQQYGSGVRLGASAPELMAGSLLENYITWKTRKRIYGPTGRRQKSWRYDWNNKAHVKHGKGMSEPQFRKYIKSTVDLSKKYGVETEDGQLLKYALTSNDRKHTYVGHTIGMRQKLISDTKALGKKLPLGFENWSHEAINELFKARTKRGWFMRAYNKAPPARKKYLDALEIYKAAKKGLKGVKESGNIIESPLQESLVSVPVTDMCIFMTGEVDSPVKCTCDDCLIVQRHLLESRKLNETAASSFGQNMRVGVPARPNYGKLKEYPEDDDDDDLEETDDDDEDDRYGKDEADDDDDEKEEDDEDDEIEMPRKKFKKEHVNLIKLLKSSKKKKFQKEAKKQKKEMDEELKYKESEFPLINLLMRRSNYGSVISLH